MTAADTYMYAALMRRGRRGGILREKQMRGRPASLREKLGLERSSAGARWTLSPEKVEKRGIVAAWQRRAFSVDHTMTSVSSIDLQLCIPAPVTCRPVEEVSECMFGRL